LYQLQKITFKQILNISSLIIDQPISCLVGSSGSGKTTLLRLLNKMILPDQGDIFYKGEDIKDIPSVELRRRVIMLAQNPVIYPMSIEENLQMGLYFSQKPLAKTKVLLEYLKKMGLSQDLKGSASRLSGGEKQRICLARVLLMDGETYLLDEPSSSLDKETEGFIIEGLQQYAIEREKQMIMVTHSKEIATKYQQSVIPITNGRVEGQRNE